MTLQILRPGILFSGSSEDLERLRIEFDQKHYVKLPQLLEPGLLQSIQHRIDQAKFYKRDHKKGGVDAVDCCMKDDAALGILVFLVNDLKLFQLIQEITRCGQIGCFLGVVYRLIPGSGHYDSWHADMIDNRMIAMTINLSTETYSGGILQIRDRTSGKIISEIANTGFGDGVIFRISPKLEHRISEVGGSAPRTVFTGWFRSKPLYGPLFKPLSKRRPSPLRREFTKKRLTVSKDSMVFIRKGLFCRSTDRQLLVFNPENGISYGLDPLGASIFTLLQEPKTVFEIEERILQEYDVDPHRFEPDLLTFLQDQHDAGLVSINEKEKVIL